MTTGLNGDYSFNIENHDGKLRLVVCYGGVENVCHKTTSKNIAKFLQQSEDHLFKGRLQLHKKNELIEIFVKGHKVGEIPSSYFKNNLDTANSK
ncbi:MAG TPA: hypothetical protein VHA56_18490 [Mucilaginibacter sp.]|nr:hypothetical protein [Mucilaginibacter sp.]